MKPTKNVYYCPECHRRKMLYHSETAALNFIKFNSATILRLNGKTPVRAYLCEACAGWHLTSLASYNYKETRTSQVINQYHSIGKDWRVSHYAG